MAQIRISHIGFLFLIPLFGHGQAPQEHHRADSFNRVEFAVRRLYQQLVSRPIGGIPAIERMKSLSPYLSDFLQNRIAQARACHDDWFRLHPKNDEKAPSTWTEFGLFSGADDRGHPQAFQIEKTESEEDGSFRVYVRLTEGPQEKPWNWQVAVIVMSEEGKFVINDVVFLRDNLKQGCDGSR